MTLPGVGTTSDAQSANVSGAATADAGGAISFVGPSGIQGSTITCVATVPRAPANATFEATLGTVGGQGVIVGTWGGTSTGGRFQVGVGQTLVVTGKGLAPNTAYTCTFSQVIDVGTSEVVVPEPNFSALLATLAGAGLSGASVQVAQAFPIAPTTNTNFNAITAPFTVWSLGWAVMPTGSVAPTDGSAEFGFPGAGAIDSLSISEAGSDRLAGLHCPAGSIQLFNRFNATLAFYVN